MKIAEAQIKTDLYLGYGDELDNLLSSEDVASISGTGSFFLDDEVASPLTEITFTEDSDQGTADSAVDNLEPVHPRQLSKRSFQRASANAFRVPEIAAGPLTVNTKSVTTNNQMSSQSELLAQLRNLETVTDTRDNSRISSSPSPIEISKIIDTHLSTRRKKSVQHNERVAKEQQRSSAAPLPEANNDEIEERVQMLKSNYRLLRMRGFKK
jgi:hypothetical protein